MADKSRFIDPFAPPAIDWGDTSESRFDFVGKTDELESERMPPDNLSFARPTKITTINALKRKFAIEQIGRIPEPDESIHIVTNARFDFWDWVPAILELAAPRVAVEWYGSTWILNRRNAVELLGLYDEGKIQKIGFITGIYFKRREGPVFATLYEGLMKRGQRFKACLNHSKWFTMLLDDGSGLTVETSANFTENGNIETFVYTNHRGLFEFHKGWIDDLLDN